MKKTVLVVDDEEIVRSILKRMLGSFGYEVVSAADGPAALARVAIDPPALVLLDIEMPKGGGLRFLADLKRMRPDIPVIMVSGTPDEDKGREAMDLGAADYVAKPIDVSYLQTSVWANLAAA